MHPELEKSWRALKEGLRGLSPADADLKSERGWSMAMVFEHLDLTYTRSAQAMLRRIAKGDAPARPRTFRESIARLVVVVIGYFPAGRKSPEGVVPQGRPFSEVAAELERHVHELDAALVEAERVFGAKRPILNHPVIGPFSVADWRRFHWVHTRHHLKQIQERRRLRATS